MTKQLRFDSHASFHRQVLRMSAIGAVLGFVAYLSGLVLASAAGNTSGIIQLTLGAAIFGFAANPPTRKEWLWAGLLGVGLALLGTLALRALSMGPPAYPWFGVGIYGLAVGLIAGRDLRDYRRYVLPLATALSMALAWWVVLTIDGRMPLTDYIPAFLAGPVYGAGFGFLVSTALIIRQLRIEHDRVKQEYDRIQPDLNGEMAELCERAMGTYGRIKDALTDRENRGVSTEPKLQKGVEDLLMKIISLGRRWQEVEREANRTSADSLADRVTELESKIASSKDKVARRQYELARDALVAQLGYLRDISRSRERVIARVHNYLAALERVHLAVLNHQGADAAKFSDELQPILDDIDDIGTEIDIASEAISEAAEVMGSSETEMDSETETATESATESETEAETESDSETESDEPEALAEADAPKQITEGESPASDEDPEKADEDPETALNRSAFE